MNTHPKLYDTHMHTPLCGHAVGEPAEYAAEAERKGLRGIVFTCHNPNPDGWSPRVRMGMDEFVRYLDIVGEARREWAGRVDVRLGIESDFAPGLEPWLETFHAENEFHYVLGSVHPHLPQYKARFYRGDIQEFQATYFRHLAEAAESGLFDCLSHPDLVKNDFPRDWDPEAIRADILRALDRIAHAGTAMELNTSGLLKSVPEMNPGPRILAEMQARGIPVVIGSDAHKPERVGDNFVRALDLLEAAGYANAHYFLDREIQTLSIAEARSSL
jgi:histidinol-phosphatase (PHP family)